MNMVKALNLAMDQELARDNNVVAFGEDVGEDGGVFRVTEGLYKKYPGRVFSTPLAEAVLAGAAFGMAAFGLKPIVEFQFSGFFSPALDQIINHVSRIRTRSRGRFTAPMVIRVPFTGRIRALEHHSESPEVYTVHAPGMKVVVPATPYEAKGLLSSAVRDPDPVVFFEPKRVYRAIKEDVPEEEYQIPIGPPRITNEGSDVTLVTWGAMHKVALEAVKESKLSVEVVNLTTLSPLDDALLIESVKKTGRVVILHEAPRTAAFGAEVAALIADKALTSLEAPIKRVTGWDTIINLPVHEQYYFPDADRVVKALQETVKF